MPTHLLYGLHPLFDRQTDAEEKSTFTTFNMDSGNFPSLQICEDDENMRVRALLPGVARGTLSLTLENGMLILRGNVPAPKGVLHRRERATGTFQREVRLPFSVDDSPVDAVLRDGVLTVTLPKAARTQRRAINVHYAGVLS